MRVCVRVCMHPVRLGSQVVAVTPDDFHWHCVPLHCSPLPWEGVEPEIGAASSPPECLPGPARAQTRPQRRHSVRGRRRRRTEPLHGCSQTRWFRANLAGRDHAHCWRYGEGAVRWREELEGLGPLCRGGSADDGAVKTAQDGVAEGDHHMASITERSGAEADGVGGKGERRKDASPPARQLEDPVRGCGRLEVGMAGGGGSQTCRCQSCR